MTATIAYDLPVRNLIDELTATGHVTQKAFRKTSVTFHHNGARLSHLGVLSVWQVRPASAHFDVDGAGAVCQYVEPKFYAWAVGNTAGNQSTISIEMANATLSPGWTVAEVTWKSAARLAGWLFAHVIGAAPTRSNVFVHHHWSATACAGPYMDKVFDQLLSEVQRWYSFYTSTRPTPPKVTIPPVDRPRTIELQRLVRTTPDGKWGSGTDGLLMMMRAAAKGSRPNVRAVQRIIGTPTDGIWGKLSAAALKAWVVKVQKVLRITADGDWGPKTDAAFLAFRKANLGRF